MAKRSSRPSLSGTIQVLGRKRVRESNASARRVGLESLSEFDPGALLTGSNSAPKGNGESSLRSDVCLLRIVDRKTCGKHWAVLIKRGMILSAKKNRQGVVLHLKQGADDGKKGESEVKQITFDRCRVDASAWAALSSLSNTASKKKSSFLAKRLEILAGNNNDDTLFFGEAGLREAKNAVEKNLALANANSVRYHSAALPKGRVFPRQQPALDFIDNLNPIEQKTLGQGWKAPCIFSVEDATKNGARMFVVLGREDLINFYMRTTIQERHIYEIIRETSVCRLYFDLEFLPSTDNGGTAEGQAMVDFVIHSVGMLLHKQFGLLLERQHVQEFDSSSESKFSRHLIIHIDKDKYVFANNRACGVFAKQVFEYARSKLLVLDKSGELSPFIDLGVYTRNRAFRLPLACKYGKQRYLLPANTEKNEFSSRDKIIDLLEGSLVCPPIYHAENESSRTAPSSQQVQRFTLPVNEPDGQTKPLRVQSSQTVAMRQNPQQATSSSSPYQESQKMGTGSPGETYARIENLIVSYACQAGAETKCPPPAIRSWKIASDPFGAPLSLTLNFEKHRFCARIRRPHRSNNVYYTYDFHDNSFRQGCYDPDCRKWLGERVGLAYSK